MNNLKLLPFVIVGVLAFLALLRFVDTAPKESIIKVKYVITGDAPSAAVYFTNLQGSYQQLGEIELPWEHTETIKVKEPRNFYLQLQGSTRAEGSVQSRIFINDVLVKEAFSRGKYVSAITSVMFSSEDKLFDN